MKSQKITSANINEYGSDYYTPIGRACANGDIKKIKQLLQTFPEIDLSKGKLNPENTIWNLTAIDLVNDNPKIIELLAAHDPTILKAEAAAGPVITGTGLTEILMNQGVEAFLQQINTISSAHKKGVSGALKQSIKQHKNLGDISSLQKSATTLKAETGEKNELFVAITADNAEAAMVLLQNCPMLLHKANSLGQTALHYAARKGRDEILKFLLEQHPDLSALDQAGFSPLDYALKENHASTATLLIKHGLSHSKFRDNYQRAQVDGNKSKIAKLEGYVSILNQAEQDAQIEPAVVTHTHTSYTLHTDKETGGEMIFPSL